MSSRLQPHQIDPEAAVRAVIATLASRCDPGEIDDVTSRLLAEIKTLWPSSVRQKMLQRLHMRSAARLCNQVLFCGAVILPLVVEQATGMGNSRFTPLLGAWSGSGRSTYQDGQTEPIRCNAYYSESGSRLRLAIRCQSASNEIEIRGQLTANGDHISGTWEERTFNASGEANGRFTGNRISVSVEGGGFSGTMSVQFGAGRQVVTIATEGISLKSVTVTLLKAG
ncbi:MAG: hypothetical protein HC869_00780 [Rhodospirillales bacterium]|nr:hypothetical protein [Rhodospirillales bacterium]